jgi:predicted TIM-barrel fold metal-dependent hydrolase
MPERIISADSHFDIPFKRVLAHIPQKYRETAVAMRAGQVARSMKAVNDASAKPVLRNKPGGLPRAPQVPRPEGELHPAAGRPGRSDPHARLADMDVDQVDAEVLYLNFDFGTVEMLYGLDDAACSAGFHALATAAIEVAAVDPDRLVPVYPIALHDLDFSIKEANRIAGAGGRAVVLPSYPPEFSLAPYWDEVYDPLFSTLEDLGIAISQHFHKRRAREIGGWDPTPARAIRRSLPPIFMSELLGGWVLTGIFDRHPRLKVVLAESGLGWIPYYLQRLDKMKERHGWAKVGMTLPKLPSEYWYSNMAATFEEDVVGMKLLDELGVDNVMWATDYPHPDCTWPESQKVIHEHFNSVAPDVMRKIIGGNAARIYNL